MTKILDKLILIIITRLLIKFYLFEITAKGLMLEVIIKSKFH